MAYQPLVLCVDCLDGLLLLCYIYLAYSDSVSQHHIGPLLDCYCISDCLKPVPLLLKPLLCALILHHYCNISTV